MVTFLLMGISNSSILQDTTDNVNRIQETFLSCRKPLSTAEIKSYPQGGPTGEAVCQHAQVVCTGVKKG